MSDLPRSRSGPAASNRRAAAPGFEHGLRRASDAARPAEPEPTRDFAADPPAEITPPRRPNGLPMLLLVALALLTAAGIVQVRARARVLELGAEITELTAAHSGLIDQRRRLEAERAYLRHPDYIHSVAASRLQMVPVAPERVQTIRLQPEPSSPGAAP